jgi:hypothetical protein
MAGMVQLQDDKGFYALPGMICGHPVAAKAQKLTNATADTDTTASVIAGKSYRVTAQKTGGFYLGIADVTTDANKLWCIPVGETAVVHMDEELFSASRGDTVTLHYATDTNAGVGYLVELAEPKHLS